MLVTVLCTPCYEAAARNEHLEPVQRDTSCYRDTLLSILHSGFNKTPQARYTVIPAFTPEYAWSLENSDTDSPVLIVNTLRANFWYTKRRASATSRITIGQRLSTAIAELFHTVRSRSVIKLTLCTISANATTCKYGAT